MQSLRRYHGSAVWCRNWRVFSYSVVDIQCCSHSTHCLVNIPLVAIILSCLWFLNFPKTTKEKKTNTETLLHTMAVWTAVLMKKEEWYGCNFECNLGFACSCINLCATTKKLDDWSVNGFDHVLHTRHCHSKLGVYKQIHIFLFDHLL